VIKPLLQLCCYLLASHSWGFGLSDCKLDNAGQMASIAEHMYGGALSSGPVYARHGYVMSYNRAYHVPAWAAWHAIHDYRDTPKRASRWSTFRTDPQFGDVKDTDYKGWFNSEYNFARGHLVPYYISGGDRDDDGRDAEFEGTLAVDDPDDACTVYEINALSNITPQYHRRFNGGNGLWYQLETAVREMVDNGREFYLLAGTVFIPQLPVQTIGDRHKPQQQWQIGVPHGFFKVVVDVQKNEAVAFLFDHSADLSAGCSLEAELSRCIVSFAQLKAATGLHFFRDVPAAQRQSLESFSTAAGWAQWQ